MHDTRNAAERNYETVFYIARGIGTVRIEINEKGIGRF